MPVFFCAMVLGEGNVCPAQIRNCAPSKVTVKAEQFGGGLLGTFHPITSALPIALNVRQVDAYMGVLRQDVIAYAANQYKYGHT